ncbi:GNAT family N-acetyltransferase [Paenibacillus pinistramenti]|uniref:GNAT family N-acetyltransferase n=1 Tax=Paenibacillus pinistramenti TaxID=1768003 RepID=UPI001109711B|nr:GNAT family N-acetyltransferase [Paenibacillus pinistramenti]
MLIREAKDDELEQVRRIMIEAFAEYQDKLVPPSGALSETTEQIREKLSGRGGTLLVFQDSEAIGSAQYYAKEDYLYIGRISVLPQWRGQGIGKAIVSYLEELAASKSINEIRLGVRLSLPQNVDYYTKLNYKPIEEHEYPCKSDRWYIMSKMLDQQER